MTNKNTNSFLYRLMDVFFVFALMTIGGAVAYGFSRHTEEQVPAVKTDATQRITSRIPHIIDGDSLLFGQRRVRLIGIDAPELAQRCKQSGHAWQCGQAARDYLENLIAGRPVTCTILGRDRYARDLATCQLQDINVNRSLVAAGWAVAYGGFTNDEAYARKARRGIWAGTFEAPSAWRKKNKS